MPIGQESSALAFKPHLPGREVCVWVLPKSMESNGEIAWKLLKDLPLGISGCYTPFLNFVVLGIKFRALCMLTKYSHPCPAISSV